MHAEHVAQVLVGGPDLEHLEGRLVVAVTQEPHDEPDVDGDEHGVHADHRPDLERGVEHDQDHARDRVEHAEAQHARLQQGVDEQGTPAPPEDVEPVVGEPGHGGRLLPAVTRDPTRAPTGRP